MLVLFLVVVVPISTFCDLFFFVFLCVLMTMMITTMMMMMLCDLPTWPTT